MPYLEDLDSSVPDRCNHDKLTYITGSVQVPTAANKPHMAIMMYDASVAPEGKVLRSELDAAVTLIREQLRSGRFTDHHTKPVLVYTFQWETHARITQVHLDAKLNKLVVRQSRLLDVKGKEPPPDAYILLRWLLNSPVGPTKHEQIKEDAFRGRHGHDFAAEQPIRCRRVEKKMQELPLDGPIAMLTCLEDFDCRLQHTCAQELNGLLVTVNPILPNSGKFPSQIIR
ncbi:hypothetical protein VTK26DRAFT_8169 [Humicola hyalothermophila]